MAIEFTSLNIVLGSGIFALFVAVVLAVLVLRKPTGTKKMQAISEAIKEGASAYLKRQYKTITIISIPIILALWHFIGIPAAISFVIGAVSSAAAGFIGMTLAVRSNVRTAAVAQNGILDALKTAFKGGAVTGMAVVGLGLLSLTLLYDYYQSISLIVGYGFGASLISLFARVGGGIYTKAADVGADLVGKVEKGIPEDDPRNPAVIADNVGDNVGDCAGMAADVFESYVVTALAAMLLGTQIQNGIWLPLIFYAIGVLGSAIAIPFVRAKAKPMAGLTKGLIVGGVITTILAFFATIYFATLNIFFAFLTGLIVTLLINLLTYYYTDYNKPPVHYVANSAKTGAGTNVIAGLAVGLRAAFLPSLVVCAAILISYLFAGVYGIAISAVGLLSITGLVLAIDSYGPISDNAGGIAEMAGLPEKTRKVTDVLDAAGNTTKATTKGVAIASAALAALALFVAFAKEVNLKSIDILSPAVVIGLLLGGAIPFLFSSSLVAAVGKTASSIVEEVRRQWKEIKGIATGKAKPEYGKCVDICTKSALKEMVGPGLLAVFAPLAVGFLLGPAALGGLLAGSIITGFLLALHMATAGAAWDNAKKWIETGQLGGKGSDAHKAAVVGDTVGDVYKDTSGPALNALIKVMNTISIVFATAILAYGLKLF
ncbi:MAG: sodium-translocating pyrophosphatase [Candidatus Nanoarchaeia archaeon]